VYKYCQYCGEEILDSSHLCKATFSISSGTSIDDVRDYINDESWIPNALLELDAKLVEIDSEVKIIPDTREAKFLELMINNPIYLMSIIIDMQRELDRLREEVGNDRERINS